MEERELRALIEEVRAPARSAVAASWQTMVGLGLTAPLAGQILASAGNGPRPGASPRTRRPSVGGGGPLKVLWWQSPTLLNPHSRNRHQDQDGSRIFYEPLAAFDPDGNLVPILAAEIPSIQNGAGGEGRQVDHLEAEEERRLARWQAVHRRRHRLQLGVRGRSRHPPPRPSAPTRTSRASTRSTATTVKLTFKNPTPFWADGFCGYPRDDHPEARVRGVQGAKSREAPANVSSPSAPAPTSTWTSSPATSSAAS